MEKLNVFVILVIGVVCVVSAKSENVDNSNSIDDSWAKLGRQTRKMWSTCKKVNSTTITNCLKYGSLHILDKMIDEESIPLTDSFKLVKKDYTRKSLMTTILYDNVEATKRGFDDEKSSLAESIKSRLYRLFNTHRLSFDIQSAFEGHKETARHRRRHQMGVMMMMFGVGMMMFVGFQFLAVLGGKAFLMAKLALLLASVNGLKRIASSGVHYGLYHTVPEQSHGGPFQGFGFHQFADRDAFVNHPRYD